MAAGNLDFKILDEEAEDVVKMYMRAKLLEKEYKYEAAIEEYIKVLEVDP
jgi:hypothetical protein